jgi:hypothetical protein
MRELAHVHDALMNGRAFSALTVIDQCSRWSPTVQVAHSMSGGAVAQALERVISKHGKPKAVTVDSWHPLHFARAPKSPWKTGTSSRSTGRPATSV